MASMDNYAVAVANFGGIGSPLIGFRPRRHHRLLTQSRKPPICRWDAVGRLTPDSGTLSPNKSSGSRFLLSSGTHVKNWRTIRGSKRCVKLKPIRGD